MPSGETFLESGQLSKKNFQSRNLNTCAVSSTQCPNFRGLFTSKVTWQYTWNLKPKRSIVCSRYDIRSRLRKLIVIFFKTKSGNFEEHAGVFFESSCLFFFFLWIFQASTSKRWVSAMDEKEGVPVLSRTLSREKHHLEWPC